MSDIIVKHTRIEITDYDLNDASSLEKEFMIWNDHTHSYDIEGMLYDPANRILILPRGYDIDRLERIFKTRAILDSTCDPYDNVSETRLAFIPRDDIQVQAIQFMVGDGKYSQNKHKSQIFLNLLTGKGKTYCTVYSSAFLRLRTIVIASNTDWLKQWKSFILEYTDTKPTEIFMIAGTAAIRRIDKYGVDDIKYILVTHATLRTYASNHGWESITELFKRLRVGFKVYDEAHLDFSNICSIDFHTDTFKTVYITATDKRSDRNQNTIYQKYFMKVPLINLFNQETDPHTKYIALKYDSNPTEKELARVMSNPTYGFDRNNYTNYVVNKPNYYRVLLSLLKIALKIDGKALFYIGTNEAIRKTYEWIERHIPSIINDVGIYTSIIPEQEKGEMLSKKIIFSTTRSAGAASDIKGLRMTVVLAEPFKSEVTARQTIGRTRDGNTYYFECVDIGFSSTMKYYKVKKPIFSTYAISCTEIILTEEDLNMRTLDFFNNFQFIPPEDMLVCPIQMIEPTDPI